MVMRTFVNYLTSYSTYFQATSQQFRTMSTTKMIPHMKTISISPGGFLGYYSLGVADYLKDHYDLTNCLYTGASAGAWIAAMMSYKGNHKYLMRELDIFSDNITDAKNFQLIIKQNALAKFRSEDFDLHKVFIGTTKLKGYKYSKEIHHGFTSLKDMVDCCEASSHVPFISGNIINKYKEELHFDGAFCDYPYLESTNKVLHISPDVWKPDNKPTQYTLLECIGLFSRGKRDLRQLYYNGYEDTKKNKHKLDKIFPKRIKWF